MTAEHFALVPPESPALNGGDWLDLGTKECPACDGVGGPYPVKGNLTAPRCLTCNGSGRVPVVPTWTCPTCRGGGMVPSNRHDTDRPLPCPTCNGSGVVSQGWLALGAAAHVPDPNELVRCPVMCHGFGVCNLCGDTGQVRRAQLPFGGVGLDGRVTASLSELVRVQRVPVVEDVDDVPDMPALVQSFGQSVTFWPEDAADDGEVEDITDQFSVKPNPGDLVWRIVERVTLSDPITGWPCDCDEVFPDRTDELCQSCCWSDPPGTVPLPQQVGWYQADDALVAEIERRKP